MTKEEEFRIFKRFIDKLQPNGSWSFSSRDTPDIELILPHKKIGVEITEIMDERQRSRQMLIKKIGETVVANLDSIGFRPFHLNLNFESELQVKKSDIPAYSKIICEYINKQITVAPNKEIYHLSNIQDCITVFRGFTLQFSHVLSKSYFTESASGILPNLSKEQFQKILRKKNEVTRNYKLYDEQWLLIVEGNFLAGSIDKIEINYDPIDSIFDRIFIFRQLSQEIIEIEKN